MIQLKKYQFFIGLSSILFPLMANAIDTKVNNQSKIIQHSLDKSQPTATPKPTKRPVNYILYMPPKPNGKGQPKTRTSHGGTRGRSNFPTITLLAPDQYSIFTARSQPILYWHLSSAAARKITVTITADEVEPLVEHVIQNSNTGIHSLRLADLNIVLQPDKKYEWSVCIHEKSQLSTCVQIAKSFIQLSENLVVGIKASPKKNAKILAYNGFWYDALEQLMEASLKTEAKGLLNQIGLSFSEIN